MSFTKISLISAFSWDKTSLNFPRSHPKTKPPSSQGLTGLLRSGHIEGDKWGELLTVRFNMGMLLFPVKPLSKENTRQLGESLMLRYSFAAVLVQGFLLAQEAWHNTICGEHGLTHEATRRNVIGE